MSSHFDSFVASGSSPTQSKPDFQIDNHGSIFLVRPLNPHARTWIDEHIGSDNGFQPYYPAVVVEHRYIGAIAEGIVADGLVLA